MRFAHMSDCHIGSWQRTPKLTDASTIAFSRAIDKVIDEKLDFVLICGDLFDTSLPAVDKLKEAAGKLKETKDAGIPVYVIAGSHDYSPTGKTMLEVLEKAGLIIIVPAGKFITDRNSGAKITGMEGRKGGLEKKDFETLSLPELENEKGFKIFMFHSGIEEYKPAHLAQMEAVALEKFPKKFDYYAGGHIHHAQRANEKDYGTIAFPGPLFPNSFDELARLGHGGFYIVQTGPSIMVTRVDLKVHSFRLVEIDCDGKSPRQAESLLLAESRKDSKNTIIGIKLQGMISEGKTTDISYNEIFDSFHKSGAVCVLKNTYALKSEIFEEEKKDEDTPAENVEEQAISENIATMPLFGKEKDREIAMGLMRLLSKEKDEGERQADFENRIISESLATIHLTSQFPDERKKA